MRTWILLLTLSFGPVVINGQVAPPKPVPSLPPPPPPPEPTVGSGNTGFQLLKIPVTGNYFLGMTRTEYDSLKNIAPLTLKTGKAEYGVTAETLFSGRRLFMLTLTQDSNFNAAPADIVDMYLTKLGEPDNRVTSDTTVQLPGTNDPSLKTEYPVKKVKLTWNFQYHDIFITVLMIDLRNGGTWRFVHTIRYEGNELFRSMLKNLELREGN